MSRISIIKTDFSPSSFDLRDDAKHRRTGNKVNIGNVASAINLKPRPRQPTFADDDLDERRLWPLALKG